MFKMLNIAAVLVAVIPFSLIGAHADGLDDRSFERSTATLAEIERFMAGNPVLSESEVLAIERRRALAAVGAREPIPSDAWVRPGMRKFFQNDRDI